MKYVVAVSGGVDSVVLLDMLVKRNEDVVVAHFDHGIRPGSDADERFVRALASKYDVLYESVREKLGTDASEGFARERRYGFLTNVTKKYDAVLVTAHHMNDVVETIAINWIRGTGWRGLAVLNREGIERPLLGMSKEDIYEYALKNNLEWVEDETNTADTYLRNRIRKKIGRAKNPTLGEDLTRLRTEQVRLAGQIDEEVVRVLSPSNEHDRYFFIMIDEAVALELIKYVLSKVGAVATRPMRNRLLNDIKTARPGTVSRVIPDVSVMFTKQDFIVKSF